MARRSSPSGMSMIVRMRKAQLAGETVLREKMSVSARVRLMKPRDETVRDSEKGLMGKWKWRLQRLLADRL